MPDDPRTHIDRDTHTIRFHRTLAASREQVFDAWTQAEQLRAWWDPTGAPLAECTVDLRPGGAFRFVNRDHAHGPPFAGVYRVVERPALLVFEAMGAVGTVRIEPASATGAPMVELTVAIQCSSAAHLAQFVQLGVDVGTARTLDNLVAHVGAPR